MGYFFSTTCAKLVDNLPFQPSFLLSSCGKLLCVIIICTHRYRDGRHTADGKKTPRCDILSFPY